MMVKITSFLGISGFHKIMGFNLLARMLMFRHLLFGLNIGFQRLGIEPYHRSINFSSETLIDLSRRILLSRGGMMILIMVRLLQKEGFRCNRNDMRKRLQHIIAPCFSLKPCNSFFKLFARIKGRPTYSICQIQILPSDGPSHLVHLHLRTLSKLPKPWSMDHWKYIQQMPQPDKVYVFDLNAIETKELKEMQMKATQKSFFISAIQGEYRACGKIDDGSVTVTFRELTRTVNAHTYSICAIAFHPELPILATYNGVDKLVKIWSIPSELSSDPVLISILKIPDGCVLSIAFHPTFPLIFCGKDNGDIEVWRGGPTRPR